MTVRRQRQADCPFVREICQVAYNGEARDISTPDGGWDLVFMRRSGVVQVLQTGIITKPVDLGYAPGDEYLAITFRPGVFMPRVSAESMVDRGVLHGNPSAGRFRLAAENLEIPSFENAEGLVTRLISRGILALDEVVDDVVQGRAKAMTPRTVQRHFERALGVTAKHLSLIFRAQDAARMLAQGVPPAQVAAHLGYFDQSHMTRSLKRVLGRTPAQIAREKRR
jgi:AraC-like DNA-binding protein